jgi:Dyp-type peroxidase family
LATQVDLNQVLDPDDPGAKDLLSNLQGNVLQSHGRDHAAYIFFAFAPTKVSYAKVWLTTFAATHVTSAERQLLESRLFKSQGASAGVFATILLTATGYRVLGFPEDSLPRNTSFRAGMKAARRRLNDPSEVELEAPYRRQIDALIILADDDENAQSSDIRTVSQQIARFGEIIGVECGDVTRDAKDRTVEPFGYVDGISQPILLQDHVPPDSGSGQLGFESAAPLRIVLAEDPNGRTRGVSFGSYFVFRKLEQDVDGFHASVRSLAIKLGIPEERAGAMTVGRFFDGTPLVSSNRGLGEIPSPNTFTYTDDPSGVRCPIQAHIRRMNPRDVKALDDHRVVRRGIPYRDDSREGKRGLLFSCYQSDIERQFEFMQGIWANGGRAPGIPKATDAIIGQPWVRADQTWSASGRTVTLPFQRFVQFRGGEYFFSPCLEFFKDLSKCGGKMSDGQLTSNSATSGNPTTYGIAQPRKNLLSSNVLLEANQAEPLRAGHFLIVHRNHCYQIDRDSGQITFLFSLARNPAAFFWHALPDRSGNIYCTISGSIDEQPPLEVAEFGQWGAVVKVKHTSKEIMSLAEGGPVVDPFGVSFAEPDQLLVADMNGWESPGLIYSVDRVNGGIYQVISSDGSFIDPQGIFRDKEGLIWVANADHIHYAGSLIRVEPNGKQTTVMASSGPNTGTICGVFPSIVDDKVLILTIDWPHFARGGLLEVNKRTGAVETLLGATQDAPKVYSNYGEVDSDGICWLAETFERELVGFHLGRKEIVHRIDLSPILGSVRGFPDSFSFIEGVHIVPPQI